jgi:hypothetical protein
MRRLLLICFTLLVAISGNQSFAAGCTTINVAPNASLCLQNSWRLIVDGTLTTLDALGSGGQLSDDTTLSFAANLHDANDAVAAMMNIRRYPTETITQADIEYITGTSDDVYAVVSELDAGIREGIEAALPKRGMKILSWLGTALDRLDGRPVFVTTYRRLSASSKAVFVVSLVRYFGGPGSFTLTLSRREDLGAGILNIMNEIQRSVRIR